MQALWWLLERMASWPGALWYFPEPALWALALAMLGALWLLLPRGMPARCAGLLLLLPLLWPARTPLADGEFEAYMLDVGQGLAMLVRTREHTLIYDAGARYPSGFDLGDAAVVPALHALGIGQVDRMILSHGDNDHAGGAACGFGRLSICSCPVRRTGSRAGRGAAVSGRRNLVMEWRRVPHRPSTPAAVGARQ